MKKEPGRIEPASLGIAESSMDPMETIRMEGNFYRGIARRSKHKKWWMRIAESLSPYSFLALHFLRL
jgi:hypothetical protein